MITTKTLLLVDDEPVFRSSLADHLRLKRSSLQILTARCGDEALKIVRSRDVDLVVTDLRMPGLDGLGLLAEITGSHPDIAVIIITAYGTADSLAHAFDTGAAAVLSKPLDIGQLLSEIDRLLKGDHGELHGISLVGFLQLLQMERKTCRVEARSGAQRGYMTFADGRLCAAELGELDGDQAVMEMAGWANAALKLQTAPEGLRDNVGRDLTHLLLEAASSSDELARDEAKGHSSEVAAAIEDDGVVVSEQVFSRLQELRGFVAAAVVDMEAVTCERGVGRIGTVPACEAAPSFCHLAADAGHVLRKAGAAENPQTMIFRARQAAYFLKSMGRYCLFAAIDTSSTNMALAWREVDATTALLSSELGLD